MSAQALHYQKWIEKEIARQRYGNTPASLYEPIRYLMGIGGKRLRPMLTLFAYSLYRDDVRNIVPYAAAVEAFHNFTLMHDDIMDNAPLRRGNPTVHEKWNVNTAILSGDVMLVKVYEMLLGIDERKIKNVLRSFNKCAAEVCEGQQWDMTFEQDDRVTEMQYISMVRQKTAVLIGFSLELGGILAEAPAADCIALRQFGTNIGIGFQLKDDLLDAYADPKKFGKQVGGDIIANKKTFLLIKALELVNRRQKSELAQWLAAKKFDKKKKVVAVKALYDKLELAAITEKKVSQYFRKGFLRLDQLSCDKGKTTNLIAFAKDLIERQS
ncbi:MAG: polyprenyl synthetase family protein [Chryseolinea sp.]